jgi:hypothetical protein
MVTITETYQPQNPTLPHMMESSTTQAKTTRKRKRGGDSLSENSDDDLKKRGRPRTEKPDASAADVSLVAA